LRLCGVLAYNFAILGQNSLSLRDHD